MLKALTLAVLSLAAATPALAQPAAVDRGRHIAEQVCASCHAVGQKGDSPIPDAPRFRDLATFESGRSLDEAFAKGMLAPHPGMPSWGLPDRDQAAILAYLRTIQRTRPL